MYLHTLVCFFFFYIPTTEFSSCLNRLIHFFHHQHLASTASCTSAASIPQRHSAESPTMTWAFNFPPIPNWRTTSPTSCLNSKVVPVDCFPYPLEWLPVVLSTIVLPQGIFTATGIWPCRDNNKEILIEPGPYLCPHLTCTHKCDTISHTIAFYHSWIALYQCSTLATLLSSSLLPFEIGMLAKQSTSWRRVK